MFSRQVQEVNQQREADRRRGLLALKLLFEKQAQQQTKRDETGATGGTDHVDIDGAAATSSESSESDIETVREVQPAAKRSRRTKDGSPGSSASLSSRLPTSTKKKGKDQRHTATKFQKWQRKTVFLVELLNTLQKIEFKSNKGMKKVFDAAVARMARKREFFDLATKWLTTKDIQRLIVNYKQTWSQHVGDSNLEPLKYCDDGGGVMCNFCCVIS